MNKQQAKAELHRIMQQKSVSISRLRKVLSVLDYEALEKGYINQAGKLKSMKQKEKEILRLKRIIYRRDRRLDRYEKRWGKLDG